MEESLATCLTPGLRTVSVTLSNLAKIGYGISNYELGNYNFYSFRTYGKIVSNDNTANVPVFVVSCLFNDNITMDCIYTIPQARQKCGNLNTGDIVTVTGKLSTTKNSVNRIVITSLFLEENTPTHLENLMAMVKEETKFCKNFHEYICRFLNDEDPESFGMLRRIKYDPKKSKDQSPTTMSSNRRSFTSFESIAESPALSRASSLGTLYIPSSTPRGRPNVTSTGIKRQNSVLFETPTTFNIPPRVKKPRESPIDTLHDMEPIKNYVLLIIKSAKTTAELSNNPWKGITLADLLTQSLSPEEKIKTAIIHLLTEFKIKIVGILTYDLTE